MELEELLELQQLVLRVLVVEEEQVVALRQVEQGVLRVQLTLIII